MAKEQLYKKKFASICFETESKSIEIVWNGFVKLEEFKEAMNAALDFYYEKNATNWLIDQTNRQAVPASVNEWVVNEFFPRLLDAATPGCKIATIVSKDVFSRFTMRTQTDSLLSKYDKKMVPFEYFQNESEAYLWFAS